MVVFDRKRLDYCVIGQKRLDDCVIGQKRLKVYSVHGTER